MEYYSWCRKDEIMDFNFNRYKFSSERKLTMASRGAVAASQPLAAQAGLSLLQQGGNAFDAALAAAAVLTVVEPTSNGLGGDCFALFKADDKIRGLNASGYLPENFVLEQQSKAVSADSKLQKKQKKQNEQKGHKGQKREKREDGENGEQGQKGKNEQKTGADRLDPYSWQAVTIPGQLAGWKHLRDNYGSLDWDTILRPAWYYASRGFPVSPVVAVNWERALEKYKDELSGEFRENFLESFSFAGRAPRPGEIWRSPRQAETFSRLRQAGVEDFYRGELAERIADFADRTGGFINFSDLACYQPREVEPLKIEYRGHEIFELPPNGQGLIALQALKILEGFEFADHGSGEELHVRIEALKLAFADGKEHIGDPEKLRVNPEILLQESYLSKRRQEIKEEARIFQPGEIDRSGTVYLAAADDRGNLISFIQSNYTGFGSGIVVPETGISLHNRGYNFVLDEKSVNYPEPGKRPYHTIIPGFYRKQGEYLGPFGVMGGFMQPQGHLQVIQNMVDYGCNPQEALDAPRWRWQQEKKVVLETGFPDYLAGELERRGHEIEITSRAGGFGRGQIIFQDLENGTLLAAVEPRADSQAAVY